MTFVSFRLEKLSGCCSSPTIRENDNQHTPGFKDICSKCGKDTSPYWIYKNVLFEKSNSSSIEPLPGAEKSS
jgi:hypothetical protein